MFNLRIAGLTIRVIHRYRYMEWLCRNYETDDAQFDFTVSTTMEEIRAEQASGEPNAPVDTSEAMCLYRKIGLRLPAYGGMLAHGAAIAMDGEGYLFMAKSGVGKSTHVKLWLKQYGSRVQVINGDKPILRRIDGQWRAYGTPWCGKERLGRNLSVPLKALCFLERAQENTIDRITPHLYTQRIFHQLLVPREEADVTSFLILLDDLVKCTPCYLLYCNQLPSAATVAYEGMRE